jgi:acetylornithine deacetylase
LDGLDLRIDAWVDAHQDEMVAFLARLVQTPSEVCPPVCGELECQKVVEQAFRQAGAAVDVFSPADVPGLKTHPAYFGTWDGMPRSMENRPDVVGVFKGTGGGRSIVLSTHVDTVSRAPLPWKEAEPFSGLVKDGKLFGRGAWDTKWGITVGLNAIKCLRALAVPLRGDVIVESVVDEEYGGGHGVLASRLRGYNADIAINSEPTSMVVAPAHHGGGEWRITVRGDAGMNFGGGKQSNPVYKLARLIEAAQAYNEYRNRDPKPPHFFEGDPLLPIFTMQVGGGGDSYADVSGIPAECYLILWIEDFPGLNAEMHTRELTGFINHYLSQDPDFDGVYPEYRPTIRYLPGSSIDPDHPFLPVLEDAIQRSRLEYKIAGAPLACDAFMFNLNSPTPAITFGPRGGNAHAADEFVLVEDVIQLTKVYARTIQSWCQSG